MRDWLERKEGGEGVFGGLGRDLNYGFRKKEVH